MTLDASERNARNTALHQELQGASDRAAAIVAAAFFDDMLGTLLRAVLVSDTNGDKTLFSGAGPLASFSSKIDLSYRLGLISRSEKRMLDLVRKIRNEFAHEIVEMSFDRPSVRTRCLTLAKKVDGDNPRAMFEESIQALMNMLSARVTDASCRRVESPKDFAGASESLETLGQRTEAGALTR